MAKDDDKDLLKFLKAFPPESRDIALALRDWVWYLYPKCNELIYDNYNFLAFGWGLTDRMSDIFCNVAVGTRGVIFGFTWGAKLDDPKGLLAGSGNQFRSLRVSDFDKFPKTYVKKLMNQAYEFSLERLKGRPRPTLNGQTIVKSISARKRRPNAAKGEALQRRERHPMPDFVLSALKKASLVKEYNTRPPYQRNDYVGWIMKAKLSETRNRRITQMLDELRRGDRYMKMTYRTASKK